jgi:hypothetical protein
MQKIVISITEEDGTLNEHIIIEVADIIQDGQKIIELIECRYNVVGGLSADVEL